MPERRRSATTARLGRMLVIVPSLVQHPGTTLDEASALFGVEQARLRKDLDLLFMSGLPPYGPGDLIDVEVDEDGAVTIRMADHFSRPLRLTRQEALAVHVREQAAAELTVAATAVEQARETARIAVVRYDAGLGTVLEVLSAQATLAQIEFSLASARFNQYAARVQLILAAGGSP